MLVYVFIVFTMIFYGVDVYCCGFGGGCAVWAFFICICCFTVLGVGVIIYVLRDIYPLIYFNYAEYVQAVEDRRRSVVFLLMLAISLILLLVSLYYYFYFNENGSVQCSNIAIISSYFFFKIFMISLYLYTRSKIYSGHAYCEVYELQKCVISSSLNPKEYHRYLSGITK